MTVTNPPVTFDFTAFKSFYPVFNACTEAQAQFWFDQAGLYCSNNTCNPAYPDGKLATLLYMLTAHVGWLSAPRDAVGIPAATGTPAQITGRTSSATEGSVSIQSDIGDTNGGSPSQWWYMLTPYGQAFWAASAPYRTARYVANPTYVPGTGSPLGIGRFGRVLPRGWGR